MKGFLKNGTALFLVSMTVLFPAGCKTDAPDDGAVTYKDEVSGDPRPRSADPGAWAADPYNVEYRIFPNAPADGILEYPWGSGTDNYFDENAPVSYWNNKHIHKYPDIFHFADGRPVTNIADFELRQKEIFNILSYYMHGRMPSIDPSVVDITWTDNDNTCAITVTHIASGRTANISVAHTPPSDAVEGAKDKILSFGVWGAGQNGGGAWGTAIFNTSWGGSESDRTGTVATLYGLSGSAADTPSANMSYAWAMGVILTVIEEGGFRGLYDPAKVSIYGFSRFGKAAMCIGAFAQGRGGSKVGQVFIGSAGSGGPVIDRFIAQAGYLYHTADPLPIDGTGAKNYEDLYGITWYQRNLSGVTVNGISVATPAAGADDRQVIRGWSADTPGIIGGHSLIYNENYSGTFLPHTVTDFGWIQNLSQARNETRGWFSARFSTFTDLHNGLNLDMDHSPSPNTGRGKEGVLCNMPFDAHYIAALIAPRIVYYEDGYNTRRNNPEGQWANWLINDEVYRMYAEELNDETIIWRNAIKMYHIPHMPQAYQTADEALLVNTLYKEGVTAAELKAALMKLRTPPFPVDDPRYRWDFNRMDIGRPGHPTIAERVWRMRNSTEKVKPMDWRGLLDVPERLE